MYNFTNFDKILPPKLYFGGKISLNGGAQERPAVLLRFSIIYFTITKECVANEI